MTWTQRVREARARLVGGFLADPTHVSLGVLCLALAVRFVLAALNDATLLPEVFAYAWAVGLALAGLGKVTGPFLALSPRHEDTARAIILSSSILAGTCWATIAVATLFLGVGASLGAVMAVALAVGAFGRAASVAKTTQTVDRHAREVPPT